MLKKITYTLLLFVFITSCSETFSSVKRGLTGTKANSADEFLVKKKDPLILPPDFENLPTPDERVVTSDDSSIFEKTMEDSNEDGLSESNSAETSILKKIQKK